MDGQTNMSDGISANQKDKNEKSRVLASITSTMPDGNASHDDNGNDNNDQGTAVQLGYAEPIEDSATEAMIAHNNPCWEAWDGGQLGGQPSWLNPEGLPSKPLECEHCASPNNASASSSTPSYLRFVCQLYAPADHVNEDAYHRTIYVFCCPRCCADERSTTTAIRVFRSQLPVENPYYPSEEALVSQPEQAKMETQAVADGSWIQHKASSYGNQLCVVCGQLAKGKCPVQKMWFCGRHHQTEHKKHVYNKWKKSKTNKTKSLMEQLQRENLPSVYRKYELVVEEEPADEDEGDVYDDEDGGERAARAIAEREGLRIEELDENDTDAQLEQQDLNDMVQSNIQHDATTLNFQIRVGRAKQQCLRYQWRGDPLWIRSDFVPNDTDIPDCPHCGAPRICEFQLMPQMLHYLLDGRKQSPTTNTAESLSAADSTTDKGATATTSTTASADSSLSSSSSSASTTTTAAPSTLTAPPTPDSVQFQALSAASGIIENAPPEQVPPSLKDQHDATIANIQKQLLDSSGKNEIEWGVVAVYTCSQSCNPLSEAGKEGNDNNNDSLGALLEEFAWKQPSP